MKSLMIATFVMSAAIVGSRAANAQFPTTNLLTNPGAETGTIAGWISAMDITGSTPPGVDDGSFDGGIDPRTGKFDFVGGTNAVGTLTQAVSLLGIPGVTTTQIDTGKLTANVSFFEQSLLQGPPDDNSNVTLNFFNGSSTLLGSVTTATVDSTGSWLQGTGFFLVPVGTRTIGYQINFLRNVGDDNDSFVDDNSLTISSGASTGTAPEPMSLLLTCPGLLGLAAILRRRA